MEGKSEEKKGLLKKLKDGIEDQEAQIQILGTFVRLGVVVWSGFIITLNYVEIPMVIPPADLERPKDTQAEPTTEEPEPPKLTIPVLDIQMPVPETAVVVTAVTTAVVAVATTSVTQTLFEPIKKKVQKQLQAKVNKWKENRKKKKDSSENSKKV